MAELGHKPLHFLGEVFHFDVSYQYTIKEKSCTCYFQYSHSVYTVILAQALMSNKFRFKKHLILGVTLFCTCVSHVIQSFHFIFSMGSKVLANKVTALI